jgi:hypothetical protein
MPATAKRSPAFPETFHEPEPDDRRRALLRVDHRRALSALAAVTLRYQVHNELSVARRQSEADLRESESRVRTRPR